MLGFVCVLDHVLKCFDVAGAQHDKTHCQANSFTTNRRIRVKCVPQVLVDALITRSHASNAQAKGTTVLNDFFCSFLEVFTNQIDSPTFVICIDQAKGVE
jgi:hypothetical protein